MRSLNEYIQEHKGKNLLAIFSHPDDESFVSGGLFQLAEKYGINTHLVCLTKGGRGQNSYGSGNLKKIRTEELDRAAKILGIDKITLFDYPDARLRYIKDKWIRDVSSLLKSTNPDIIVTFDHSGITGHPDHITTSFEIMRLVKNIEPKPALFWRVPDAKEKKYFKDNKALVFASKQDFELSCSLRQSITKIKAICAHKSQMKSFGFKLQILEWFLFDHKEPYFLVDFKKKYFHRFVEFKI